MSTNWSPPKTATMATPGGLLGLNSYTGADMQYLDNSTWNPLTKIVQLRDTPVNFFCHQCMVPFYHSNVLQALPCSTTMPHSTWHLVPTQLPVQGEDFQGIGCCGNVNSPKVAIMNHKCTILFIWQGTGSIIQAHFVHHKLYCLSIQLFGKYVQPVPCEDHTLVYLCDPPWASQWKDSSWKQHCGKQMLHELWTCSHCWNVEMINMMKIMRPVIC